MDKEPDRLVSASYCEGYCCFNIKISSQNSTELQDEEIVDGLELLLKELRGKLMLKNFESKEIN